MYIEPSDEPKIPSVEVKPITMPFSAWYPIVAGAFIGVVLRWGVFSGSPGNAYSAMLGSFIYLIPFVVGAVTIYVAERTKRRSWGYYFWAAFLANIAFVFGTLIIMIEGLICAVVIVPMFSAIGALGGLAMGIVCRATNWPKQTLYSFLALPLLLGGIEPQFETPSVFPTIERTIHIAAKPSVVWDQINKADRIQPNEVEMAWAYRIGVPMPLSGMTIVHESGFVRKIRMGKNVHFDQVIVDWQPNRLLKSTYKFYPDSFPAGALDDHVVIGGHYFDLLDTTYQLEDKNGGTDLTIQVHYRISTQFNLYANWVARLLLGNFQETILQFYRRRSEAL